MISMDAPKKQKRFYVSREDYQWAVSPTHIQDSGQHPTFEYEHGMVKGLTVWAVDEAHALTKARNAIRAFQIQVEEEFLA